MASRCADMNLPQENVFVCHHIGLNGTDYPAFYVSLQSDIGT